MPQNKVPGFGKGSCAGMVRYARNPDSTLANDPDFADKAYTKQGNVVADTPEGVEEQFADLRRYWDPKQDKPSKYTFFHLETSFSPSDPKSTIENVIEFKNRFYDQKETRDWQHTTDLHLNRPHLHFHDAVNFMKTSGKRIPQHKVAQWIVWPLSDKIAKDMGMKIIPPKLLQNRNLTPLEAAANIEGKTLEKSKCAEIVIQVLKKAEEKKIRDILTFRDELKQNNVDLIRSSYEGGLTYSYNGYCFSASSLGGSSFQLGGLVIIFEKGYDEGLRVIDKNLQKGKKMQEINILVADQKYNELNVYNSKPEQEIESKLELEDALDKLRATSNTLEQFKEELSTLRVVTRGQDDFTYEYEGLRTTQYQLPKKFRRIELQKYFEGKGKEDTDAASAGYFDGRKPYMIDKFDDEMKPDVTEVEQQVVKGERRKT